MSTDMTPLVAPHIAVVGAGMAGLSCAKRLHHAGLTVQVFETASVPGGRVSNTSWGMASFDDGAQFLTVRSPVMQQQMVHWLQSGMAAVWTPRMSSQPTDSWYVGVPTMSALTADLSRALNVRYSTPVLTLQRCGTSWFVVTPQGLIDQPFDAVIVATAPLQAAALLERHAPEWANRLATVPMLPCWTVLASSDALPLPWDAQVVSEGAGQGPISWWARDDSKPGRSASAGRHHWVIQANAEWSAEHFNDADQQVTAVLLAHWSQMVVGQTVLPGLQVHGVQRWAAARRSPHVAPWTDSVWCSQRGLGVCGDGLSHSRVEQAYVSGYQVADQVLDFFHVTEQEVL